MAVDSRPESADASHTHASALEMTVRLEDVGRLARTVSHDLANVMQAVSGLCETTIASLPEDDPAYTDIVELQRAAQRGLVLHRRLAALAQAIESGETEDADEAFAAFGVVAALEEPKGPKRPPGPQPPLEQSPLEGPSTPAGSPSQ